MYNVEYFFGRNHILPENIKYITRENKRTVIYLLNGKIFSSVTPEKEIMKHLPEEKFLNISKGITVRRDQIIDIGNDGVYTMTDGRTFQGRRRSLGEHRKNRLELAGTAADIASRPPMELLEKCALADNMPLAFCIIELVFDRDNHGVDFVFRYCNKAMEEIEGVPVEEMVNRSFYEVFSNGDRKWLVSYADVALNGTRREITEYSPEIDKKLRIYCYQPAQGYCACVLIPDTTTE